MQPSPPYSSRNFTFPSCSSVLIELPVLLSTATGYECHMCVKYCCALWLAPHVTQFSYNVAYFKTYFLLKSVIAYCMFLSHLCSSTHSYWTSLHERVPCSDLQNMNKFLCHWFALSGCASLGMILWGKWDGSADNPMHHAWKLAFCHQIEQAPAVYPLNSLCVCMHTKCKVNEYLQRCFEFADQLAVKVSLVFVCVLFWLLCCIFLSLFH